ncbi:hypothetical protein LC593_11380 [Nostoc sp. CHAB 5844]|nr:hypothetical protein [Nostoc sp. CHAB 5844]
MKLRSSCFGRSPPKASKIQSGKVRYGCRLTHQDIWWCVTLTVLSV